MIRRMSKAATPVPPAAHSAVRDDGPALADEQVTAAVQSFAMLADPTRVRMLWALRDEQLDVASLAAAAGCRPTVASQHLSKLRFAGLVEGQRSGQRIIYRLRGAHVRRLLSEALFPPGHNLTVGRETAAGRGLAVGPSLTEPPAGQAGSREQR
jgi:DNA-binding transcriptional ArsR family regulator